MSDDELGAVPSPEIDPTVDPEVAAAIDEEEGTRDGAELDEAAAEDGDVAGTPPWRQADTVVPLIVGASAIVAAFSGQQPTGNALADFVLSAGLGGVVALLASMMAPSRRSWLGVAALIAFVFSGFQLPAVALAGVALVCVYVLMNRAFPHDDAAILQALVGALVVHAALSLPNIRVVASASLLAAIALAPIVIGGIRSLPAPQAKLARRIIVWAAAFAVVATALAVGTALWSRTAVERGIQQAEDGIEALEAGDQERAVALLGDAEANFATADSRLGGVLTWPSRVVPIAAQHSRALETAAAQGRNLVAAAVGTVTTADVDQIRGNNGAIDLAIVNDVNRELANANIVLRTASTSIRSVRSPWLLPLLDDRLSSVETELDDVRVDIDLANHATSVVPGILGANGARQYLVLFVQPAESREYGGFVGAYGLLRAEDGRLSLLESGGIDVDLGTGEAEFSEIGLFPEAYYNKAPHTFPQNLTGVGDLTTIYEAVQELAPQWREDPGFTIDGVFTIDPFALAGFLELTGPVSVTGRDTPIDASNVADYLLRDQYLEFDAESRDVRQEALRELAGVAFGELLSIEIPGPERLGAIFGPLARSDRLAFVTNQEAENAFLRRVLLDADLPVVSEDIEMVGWLQATGVAGKIDGYTTRDLRYEVTVDPATGTTDGLLSVAIRNEAPPDVGAYVLGVDDRNGVDDETPLVKGTNLIVASLLTRADVSDLTSPTGAPTAIGDLTPMLSYDHQSIGIEIPLGTEQVMQVELQGQVAPGRYDVLVLAQPLATTGTYDVVVRAVDGWRIVDDGNVNADGSWSVSGALEHHVPVSVEFVRES